ncbi:DUF4870 domain-containing protein [Albibacterium indicum]|uniref:DUF4870 domain-containing protein n=1 Tax=Albibacterium indicum TaxID=2292082 RepID=UPI000E48AEA7|nr:hypothetical protein [Pedobacter indicus]
MEFPENDPILPIVDQKTIDEGKTIAIIAYITVIGLIIAIVLNNDKKNAFAAFHIRQALGVGLASLVIGVLNIIPYIGWLAFAVGSILLFVMWIVGLINALSGKMKPVPVFGKQFEEWFRGIN